MGHSFHVAAPIRLWYTFGNHMHWVDMQWLWGYHVLPGSTFDMLRFCEETGAKGNVNFDGIGYEKMAAEAPEALAALRSAVEEGWIEPVGCSYGQPYGLFHGGESNIRQRVYGARTVMRLLGVRPKTFWEEEFDFFPQLPQMLRGCGFENASLYFQWTWHTPEVPFESSPVVLWEGIDGSRLLTATRNRLNLHQWPEDFQILLDELAEAGPREVLRKGISSAALESPTPGPSREALARWEGEGGHPEGQAEGLEPLVLQWLELMPSPDWMCRSELMVPKLKELLGDERFEVVFGTLSEYLDQARGTDVPVRRYGMHEVWHGLSLGKNFDQFRFKSRFGESILLAAESQAAAISLFGRPYPNWDVYPTWVLEEGWRKLLMAQHHDNDECEGLCGHVGEMHYDCAQRHAGNVMDASQAWLENSFKALIKSFVFPVGGTGSLLEGWNFWQDRVGQEWRLDGEEVHGLMDNGPTIRLAVDRPSILGIGDRTFSPPLDCSFGEENWELEFKGNTVRFRSEECQVKFSAAERSDGVKVEFSGDLPCAGPGFGGARYWFFRANGLAEIKADTAYCVDAIKPQGQWQRKYPEGDWMTSPQWFETVEAPFVAQSMVNIEDDDGQVLAVIDRTRQWFLDGDELRCVVNLRDPWDERRFEDHGHFTMQIIPHDGWGHAQMWERAQTHMNSVQIFSREPSSTRSIPPRFRALAAEPAGVLATAFYREAEDFAGRDLPKYAGRGMDYPFVVRLVEFEGASTEAWLRVAGTVASAYRTNLMGEVESKLAVEIGEDLAEWEALFADEPGGDVPPNLSGKYSVIRLPMRGREIATVYMDIVEGRKQARDLDAHREVWATMHRISNDS